MQTYPSPIALIDTRTGAIIANAEDADWWAWYNDYLQSPQWQRRAERCKRRARWTCQDCGVKGVTMQAHHIRYDNVGNENDSDLVCLCEGCHKGRHR